MTAAQAAVLPPNTTGDSKTFARPLLNFGAACWYFAQKLTDELEAVGKVSVARTLSYLDLLCA